MLERVEIVPSSRQTVRRAVEIGCELVSPSGAHVERMLDLSPRGARVRSRAGVRRGADVLLTFVPPGAPRRVSALGVVQHEADGVLGVQFTSLDRIDADTLDRHLRGLPPPLPSKTRRMRSELVWVDTLLTYEEDLGDRIHVYEVSEQLSMEVDLPETFASLSAPLGGGTRYRWRLA
ncbi:MAG: PilZ domain-containing protein [Sandaracinus sp.]